MIPSTQPPRPELRRAHNSSLQLTAQSISDTHTQLTMSAAGPPKGSMSVAPPRRPAKRMAAGSTPDMTMTGMSPRVPATNSALQLSTFEVSLSPLLRRGLLIWTVYSLTTRLRTLWRL
jgi:hypothetical protein